MRFSLNTLALCLLLAAMPLAGFSEEFHLKNGQVVKARLIREDPNHYYIQLPFGMTTLAKAEVAQMEQEQKIISPREQFEALCKNSASEKDCLDASDFALKNNLFVPALLFLKRSLVRWNPDSDPLKEKITSIEKAYAEEVTAQIKKFYDSGQIRKAALTYEEAIKIYPALAGFAELQIFKNNFSASLMPEETSMERILFYIRLFPDYSSDAASLPDTSALKTAFEPFAAEEKFFHPRFSPLLFLIEELLQHQDYIQKHKMNEEVKKPLRSRKELDASRGDKKIFNSLCSENNRIYKAKGVLRDYAQKLSTLKAQGQRAMKQLENEAMEWKAKGYEQVGGQWYKGDDLKKAKGMELHKGQWLDPKASDYAAKKAELDKPPAPILPEAPLKQASLTPDSSLKKEETPKDLSQGPMESQKELMSLPAGIILLTVLGGVWWFSRKKR